MPRTSAVQVRRSRPKLSAEQKAARRDRQEALMTVIDSAKSSYVEEAAHIAETHGRYVFKLVIDSFTSAQFYFQFSEMDA